LKHKEKDFFKLVTFASRKPCSCKKTACSAW